MRVCVPASSTSLACLSNSWARANCPRWPLNIAVLSSVCKSPPCNKSCSSRGSGTGLSCIPVAASAPRPVPPSGFASSGCQYRQPQARCLVVRLHAHRFLVRRLRLSRVFRPLAGSSEVVPPPELVRGKLGRPLEARRGRLREAVHVVPSAQLADFLRIIRHVPRLVARIDDLRLQSQRELAHIRLRQTRIPRRAPS